MKNELSAPFSKYPMVDALIIIFKSAFMVWFRQGYMYPLKWCQEEEWSDISSINQTQKKGSYTHVIIFCTILEVRLNLNSTLEYHFNIKTCKTWWLRLEKNHHSSSWHHFRGYMYLFF
jgi:hypothetical protein